MKGVCFIDKKLIGRLKQKDGLWCSVPTGEQLVIDTADALTVLLAENKRLKSLLGESGQDLWSMENQRADRLEAENARLRKERDAAVEDLRNHRKYKCDCCHYADKKFRFPCTDCQSSVSTYGDGWKWRGIKENEIYG